MSTKNTSSLPLDMTVVKTNSDEPVRKHKRIFGIQEAPTYYPTHEEFKDPLAYIKKISPEGEKYGIIKIVPPKDYHPDFCLKTENFRFKTRIQKLNSMEGETRSNVNYLEQLTKYHLLSGKSVAKIPQLDKRPIDLYKLKNEVALRGGVQEVTKHKKWAEIGRVLGYARKQCTSMSNALKSAYLRVILPYEIWYAKHKGDIDHSIKKEELYEQHDSANESNETCEICHRIENEEQILLCDGCNRGYHLYCLSPALSSVPKSDWYCVHCLTAVGKDYGFEDGDEYSLSEFKRLSDEFKKEWFEKNSTENVTEEECENEFWRLVENPHETCEVEYGADLHSTQHGSGFMSAEQMSRKNFDPWNLNVIPASPQSLFTHIKTDISGMMVPWLYVGMCFSAFCWHNEDHYTYSINYMHWGETKTWYGIPGSDTAKFEDTMKQAVPELFEQQPDLLFQLVTMLSPGRLLKEGVKVYVVDQRPGQFVITYPKAYHSGFNHGFNFCEAVNFAPGEWVDFGLECVKRYKAFRRQPCFSHDELLITAALNMNLSEDNNIDWLKRGLSELQSREIKERKMIRKNKLKEEVVSDPKSLGELQCIFCNCYTYLSFIGCSCTDKVGCLEHCAELCTCPMTNKKLYLRYTDEQLASLVKGVMNAGVSPEEWSLKLNRIMSSEPTPHISVLKEFLKQGENIGVSQELLDTLNDFMSRLDLWVTQTEQLLHRNDAKWKSHQTREEYVRYLIDEAKELGMDVPLVAELKQHHMDLEKYTNKLRGVSIDTEDKEILTSLYEEGVTLKADSSEFRRLKQRVLQGEWEQQAKQASKGYFRPKAIRKALKEAKDMDIESVWVEKLSIIEIEGKKWIQNIENVCKGKKKIDLDEEEDYLNAGNNKEDNTLSFRLEPHLMNQLKKVIHQSKSTLYKLEEMWNGRCLNSSLLERPSLSEANSLLLASHDVCFNSYLTEPLSQEMERLSSWKEQVRKVFMVGRHSLRNIENLVRDTLYNVRYITANHLKQGLWCVCRKPEHGLMVECDVCHEWYHQSCVKVPRIFVRTSVSYICPVCCIRDKRPITHITRQPKLEEIVDLITSADSFKFCPKEYKFLVEINEIMQNYKSEVQAFCRSRTHLGIGDIKMIKDYLRSLLGLEIQLQDETEFLQGKVQSLMPISKAQANDYKDDSESEHNETEYEDTEMHPVSPAESSHSPRLRRRSSSVCYSEDAPSNKRQKVIKLTVKPPSQSLNPSLKRKQYSDDLPPMKRHYQRSNRV
ncbi:hypothetical protein BDB01DRAFT_851066 [Pilobolus umbonatus]|nr:hypothetical protein BDB01DRAFT_851066 [Pilobolus umbonatus]